MTTVDIDLGAYELGWSDKEDYSFKPEKGLNETIIRQMSKMKGESAWMLEFRLKADQRWRRKPIPQWGGGGLLNEIDFDDIYYYIKPTEGQAKDWDMVPDSSKETYEKLGIIVDEEAYGHYVEGCSAPVYSTDPLHSAVVEMVINKGGRQSRLQANNEVPGRLAAGTGSAWRGVVNSVRRTRPTPGCRCQDCARSFGHNLNHHLQVDLTSRRPSRLPVVSSGLSRGPSAPNRSCGATLSSSTTTPARIHIPTWRLRKPTPKSVMKRPSPRSEKISSSI